jgi:hypothetical protein
VDQQQGGKKDTRKTLSELFTNMAAAEKSGTGAIKKLLPGSHPDAASSPLLKLASYPYLEAMKNSFMVELEKIAMGSVSGHGSAPAMRTARAPVLTGEALEHFHGLTGTGGAGPAAVGYHGNYSPPTNPLAHFGQEAGLAPAVIARRKAAEAAASKGGGVLSGALSKLRGMVTKSPALARV